MAKVRRVDFSPDEYIAGVSGRLSFAEQGLYWMVCALIYSRGGPIDDDHIWLSRLAGKTHWRTVRTMLDSLIADGKIERLPPITGGSETGQLMVKRCSRELQAAGKRSAEAAQNGRSGGRPPKKINDIDNQGGFETEKLTINHQPSTSSEDKEIGADAPINAKPSPKKISLPDSIRAAFSPTLDAEHADAVIAHRRALRKPLTERAAVLLAKSFAKCSDPNAAADLMISKGWQSFQPEWFNQPSRHPSSHNGHPSRPLSYSEIAAQLGRSDAGDPPNDQPSNRSPIAEAAADGARPILDAFANPP